jgi:dihydroorotate dehydrogenase (NAD+) catalytic subunit
MGMGGITDTRDVIEFLMAGATAVSIGTANFVNPLVTQEVLAGLRDYMEQNQITSVQELIGAALPQGLPKKGSAELT